MQNFTKLIEQIKDRELSITKTAKDEQIQQTQRNKLKTELMQALLLDIKNAYEFVYRGKDGIIIEIANDCIADNMTNDEGSGAISVVLDLSIKSLSYNPEQEQVSFDMVMQEKASKAEQKAKDKQAKIARDKADRQAKATSK